EQLLEVERVARRCVDRGVAEHRGDADELDARMPRQQQQRHRVVDARVGVVDDLERVGHSVLIWSFSALSQATVLRSGSPNWRSEISNTSPGSVRTPSAKLSVAVPNMCTCTSPGCRNSPYLK